METKQSREDVKGMEIRKTLPVVVAALAFVTAACNRTDTSTAPAGGSSDRVSQSSGSSRNTPDTYAPDNTGRNERDRSGNALTPEDQGGSDSDREITRQVRRAITADSQFSTTAGNIKIITQNGKVTLRGPVQSAQEQQAIGDLAKKVQGVSTVDNQLEVKTNQDVKTNQ